MSLIYFLRRFCDGINNIERVMRLINSYTTDMSGYSTKPNYGVEKKNVSQNIYLNKNYLLIKTQERNCYSRYTNISRKGLEKRVINKIVKEVNGERENKMKESLSRKGKRSRRWGKRHHQNV